MNCLLLGFLSKLCIVLLCSNVDNLTLYLITVVRKETINSSTWVRLKKVSGGSLRQNSIL